MSKKKKADRAFANVPSFRKLCKKVFRIRLEYPDAALVAYRKDSSVAEGQPYYLSIHGVFLEPLEKAIELPRMHEELETVARELIHGCYQGPYLKGLELWSRSALQVMKQQCMIHDMETAASLRKSNSLN